MSKIDFGGSPATPYFGEDGRAAKTEEARDSADERDVETSTGVDRVAAHERKRDDEGREVVPAQFVPGDEGKESAKPADKVPPVKGDESPEDARTKVTSDDASKAEDFDTKSKNAAETGQSKRSAGEQKPSSKKTTAKKSTAKRSANGRESK